MLNKLRKSVQLRSVPLISKKNLFIGIIILIFLAISFYIYNQQQKSTDLYAKVILGLEEDYFVAVPYWLANSVKIGDRDVSPFGKVNAEVVDAESYEGGSHGKHVILLLKLNAVRDKTSNYFYKNQPLQIDDWINMRLGVVNHKGYLVYIGKLPPDFGKKKLRVTIRKNSEDPFIVENLNTGSRMLNNKGKVMAEISEKSEFPAIIPSNDESGTPKKGIEVTVNLSVDEIDGLNYFGVLRKVKIGERLNLFFDKATLWDGVITEIEEIN